MVLSPNTLPPEPYNILAVALFLAFMGWVLTAVARLFRTLHMQKAADQGRVVDIVGLGSRLQVRAGRWGRGEGGVGRVSVYTSDTEMCAWCPRVHVCCVSHHVRPERPCVCVGAPRRGSAGVCGGCDSPRQALLQKGRGFNATLTHLFPFFDLFYPRHFIHTTYACLCARFPAAGVCVLHRLAALEPSMHTYVASAAYGIQLS